VTYCEGEIGAFFSAAIGSAILAYLYLLVLLSRHYAQVRDRRSLVIIGGLLVYFAGVVNDTAVAARVYSFIYVSEYAFMVVILAMSSVLLKELVNLYQAVEEANTDLERKVRERTQEIEALSEELRRQAELDSLTGIYNRRFFSEYLDIELRRARSRMEHRDAGISGSNDMNFGLAMIDVDHFKLVNDTFGHPAGDRVLVELVKRIRANIFSRDIFCRFGGEEFIVLFTRTSREGIVNAVEKIRKSVENDGFDLADSAEPLRVTIRSRHKINASQRTKRRVYLWSDNRSEYSIPFPAIGLDARRTGLAPVCGNRSRGAWVRGYFPGVPHHGIGSVHHSSRTTRTCPSACGYPGQDSPHRGRTEEGERARSKSGGGAGAS
jgi:diguanylate cyclase (GGDEF)-like protein